MEQLQQQIHQMQMQIVAYETKMSNLQQTCFQLTPNQIIQNFNDIPPFSGEDNYKLKVFLRYVSNVEELCGQNNEELKHYCLRRIINGKITGRAHGFILEIPESQRTWNQVVQTLRDRFRPRGTIMQLLFAAKNLKVYNIKDLCNKLTQIKLECNEICDYDNDDTYTYNSIDKEIVQILCTKLTPIVQLQIDTNSSLFDIDHIFCQTEIYYAKDVIKDEYRIKTEQQYKQNTNKNEQNFTRNGNRHQGQYTNINDNQNRNNTYSNQNRNTTPNPSTNHNQNRNMHHQYPNTNRTNNYQYRNTNTNNPFNRNVNQQQYSPQQNNPFRSTNNEPMEVDNIQREQVRQEEVNFDKLPQTTNYP